MTKTYIFKSPMDMAELARFIQTKVYWESRFYLHDDPEESIHYSDFWEITIDYIDKGCSSSVTITEDDIVTFNN